MSLYKIFTTNTTWNQYYIEAASLEEAEKKALTDSDTSPDYSEFVDNSEELSKSDLGYGIVLE